MSELIEPSKAEEKSRAIYYLYYRRDGTIQVLEETDAPYPPFVEGAEDYQRIELDEPTATLVKADIESYIVEFPSGIVNASVRKRTEAEMIKRVREIYGRVKSGELHRVPNDLIDRYKHFFTSRELEEVELPEQKVKRLETRLKALETRLQKGG